MIYLLNAFSLNMLERCDTQVNIQPLTVELATAMLHQYEFESAIGHADLAAVIANDIGLPVEVNRESVTLGYGKGGIVAQYTGPRLPEGATELPKGATILYWGVEVVY